MSSSGSPLSPCWRSSSPGSFARAGVAGAPSRALAGRIRAAFLAAAASLGVAAPAGAQVRPTVPLLPAPPLATTPLGRSLSGAYGAIAGARVTNPGAAAQASFAYVQALQQARMGNVSGALAAAHVAQATAQTPAVAPQFLLPATPVPTSIPVAPARPGESSGGNFPSTAGVPIVENGVPLSPELVVAQQEIELAGRLSRRPLDAAKAHYRAALDAYVSGNAATARSQARAAFDAAADALSTVK